MTTLDFFSRLGFTILGVVLGFLLSELANKRGISLLRPVRRRYSGHAKDLVFKSSVTRDPQTGEEVNYELGEDFSRLSNTYYVYENYEMRLFSRKVYISGIGHRLGQKGVEERFDTDGWGTFIFGNRDKGILMATLNWRCGFDTGQVIQILKYSDASRITGYWFADDSTKMGKLISGELLLTAK